MRNVTPCSGEHVVRTSTQEIRFNGVESHFGLDGEMYFGLYKDGKNLGPHCTYDRLVQFFGEESAKEIISLAFCGSSLTEEIVRYQGKDFRVFSINCLGENFKVFFTPTTYRNNGTLAVQGICVDSEGRPEGVFGTLTKNLGDPCQNGQFAFYDANNLGQVLINFLVYNGFAQRTGFVQPSGYCSYALYYWNTEAFFAPKAS